MLRGLGRLTVLGRRGRERLCRTALRHEQRASASRAGDLLAVLGVLDHKPDDAASFTRGYAVLKLGRYREQIHTHLNEHLKSKQIISWKTVIVLKKNSKMEKKY